MILPGAEVNGASRYNICAPLAQIGLGQLIHPSGAGVRLST
jgi:hypothetical protein